jgi:hypothetical protein
MRNPLKRLPTADPKPTLRERFAKMKAKAAGLAPETSQGRRAMLAGALATTLPLPVLASAPTTNGSRAGYLARLMAAYAEERAARPILNTAAYNSVEQEAGGLVLHRCHSLCAEILMLPAPRTREDLALAAMAAAIVWEAEDAREGQDQAALVMIRAMLAITGTTMPPGFTGFASDPEFLERENALFAGPGSLPAWAIAEAEAADEADT